MNDRTGHYNWRGILRCILWGLLISIPTVGIVNVAILATPHVRGIGFRPELRYGINATVCIIVCVLAAFRHTQITRSSRSTRSRFIFETLTIAVFLLFLLYRRGGEELALQSLPALTLLVLSIFALSPQGHRVASLSAVTIVLAYVVGALEVFGVGLSFASERVGSTGRIELRDISKDTWNVEHRFMTLRSGANIHYVDEGRGPVLLFLHGNPSYSFQWRGLVQQLHGSFRCVALDYPGFGFSSAPSGFGFTPAEESASVEEFVDRLGLRDITLVMQDWGGPIGLAFAERRPELIRGMILGNTWAWPSDNRTTLGKFSVIAGGPIGEFLQTSFNGFTRMGIQNGIVKKLPASTLDAYIAPSVPPNKRGVGSFYPGQIIAARDFFEGVERNLGRLRDKRALIFWGLHDVGFPRSDIDRFKQIFPVHHVVEFPNADHFFFEDEGEEMIPEIRNFVDSSQSSSGTVDPDHQES
ncbi:alpha/beta fold hydrolase [Terriglobus albidus]|nr:alpha/beta fold hydrolase [Terriglobus albidus]